MQLFLFIINYILEILTPIPAFYFVKTHKEVHQSSRLTLY